MQILRGSQATALDPAELEAALGRAARTVVDVGTGDARFAYRLARAHPDWLVVGLDPAADRMRDTARRIGRKPARGGVENLVLVVTSVEEADTALHAVADEVHVQLPWGSLLRGTVRGETRVLGAVRAVAKAGAAVHVVLGIDIWDDPVPIEVRDLPPLSVPYVEAELAPRYAEAGLPIASVRMLDADEARASGSSWGKRLARGRSVPKLLAIDAEAR